MDNWEILELKDLGEFRNGANYPKGSYGKGDKIVNVKDLFRGRYVNYENLDELKSDALSNKTLYLVQHGDLLFTRSSLVKSGAGMVAMINEPQEDVLFCGFIIRLRPDLKRVNPLYLLYLLRSPSYRKLFTDGSVQTNISNINQETLGGIKVFLPRLSEQNTIVKILDNLDAKIELNNKVNRELEAMAKTLYDYWFVQFDFPDEEGKPYKSSGGKMVYNAELKREIPEGWEAGTLGKIAELVRGVTYDSSEIKNENDEDTIPVLRATNISGNVLDLDNMVYVPKQNVSKIQLLNRFDILITMSSGSKEHIGKNGFYYFDKEVSFGAFCAKIVAKKDFRYYLYSYTQSEFMFATIKNECLGTNINNLNGSLVKGFKLVLPPIELVKKFNEKVQSIYETIGNNHKQDQHLTALRDWLLPMLMNGQVRVKEAEGKLSMAAEPSVKYGKL